MPQTNTIIEVNGPSHYIKKIENTHIIVTEELNGRSQAKANRLIEKGYKFVPINFNEIQKDTDLKAVF